MNIKEMAEQVVVLRALADELTTQAKHLQEQVADQMRQIGTDRVTVSDNDLTELGKLTKNPDRKVWGITDPHAFKEYVTQHRPQELVYSVNPAFCKWVLTEAEKYAGVVGDPETGMEIPGIGQEVRIGTFTVTKSKTAKERAITAAHRLLDAGLALPQSEE